MKYTELYDKYEGCDIILCIYLEVTGQDLDSYNCFSFAEWEYNKFQQFKQKEDYPTNELYDEYLEFLMSS